MSYQWKILGIVLALTAMGLMSCGTRESDAQDNKTSLSAEGVSDFQLFTLLKPEVTGIEFMNNIYEDEDNTDFPELDSL